MANPGIYGQIQFPRFATLAEIMEARAGREDREAAREDQRRLREIQSREIGLREQAFSQTQQRQQAIQQAYQKHTTPEGFDESGFLADVFTVDPEFANEFQTKRTQARTEASRQRAAELDEQIKKLDLQKKALDQAKGDLTDVLNVAAVAGKDDWPEVFEMADAYGVRPELTRRGFRPDFTPDQPQRAGQLLLTAKDRAEMEAKSKTTPPAGEFTLGPGSKRFSADGKVIAEVPSTAAQTPTGGFSLAPGGRRYDASGKLLAEAPQRPPQGSVGRPITSGDSGRIADLQTSLNDLVTLRATIAPRDDKGKLVEPGATGLGAQIGAALPKPITALTGWGITAKEKQATIDRVKQVIGKALEGGVLRKEDEYKYEKILPTISDTVEVVESKLNGLERAISQRLQTTLDSLEDSGYDVSKHRERSTAPKPADTTTKRNPFR